eukprot:TRINITY_DN20528_c0_g1::TRINITY_DN20528_c0_g1_i1::g.66::m.66 TRINITY_DN20528_c0_g1::TRINITY_DN20528_c0_g1_i1::g.66  ORF type:complete len:128 (-),score=25.91,sp/Q3ZCG8/EMC6_BOVIN/40.00/1e-09,Rab5ip/PF07019.7/4.1e-19,EcsC/PF12787.2/0.11,DUF1328/PF07043.8/13 TRINITY_DN20528_c0_g1_i1:710-1048(-)
MEGLKIEENEKSAKYLGDRIVHNEKLLFKSRLILAIVAGAVTGILGFTGFAGFFCYLFCALLTTLSLYIKTRFQPQPYFRSSSDIWLGGNFVQALMSFVLFWTLFYDIVHVY